MSSRLVGELKVPSGQIVVADPFTTAFDEPNCPMDQVAPIGIFPVELALARFENNDIRVACARVLFSPTQQAVRWEMASFEAQTKPGEGESVGYGVDAGLGCFFDKDAQGEVNEPTSQAWLAATEKNSVNTWTWHVADVGNGNVVMFSSGWGDGVYCSYWGFDEAGLLVELVTDFGLLLGTENESFELPLPLARGRIRHPLLEKHQVTMKAPFFSRNTAILGGKGSARVELSDRTPVEMKRKGTDREYCWKNAAPDARLIVLVMAGTKLLEPV